MESDLNRVDYPAIVRDIRHRSHELGFQATGITDTALEKHENLLHQWLDKGFHGEMAYMHKHGSKRTRPSELVPGTLRIISVRMDYLPPDGSDPQKILDDADSGYISRYALGRDYHKVMRNKLQKLADFITEIVGPFGHRVFVDSAPVLEKAIAEKAGLGWIGKHSNLLCREAGSWFFLGEIYTDLPLPVDDVTPINHCGDCTACIDICPTQAIVAPYSVDARRCISYLTIELHGTIPTEFRVAMGNRIYGCDDCQLVCPWNRFSRVSAEPDFRVRHKLDAPDLIELFSWDEITFLNNTEGSAIRRIGHQRWLRNIAVALGNALRNSPQNQDIVSALEQRLPDTSEMVQEHIQWAIEQQKIEL